MTPQQLAEAMRRGNRSGKSATEARSIIEHFERQLREEMMGHIHFDTFGFGAATKTEYWEPNFYTDKPDYALRCAQAKPVKLISEKPSQIKPHETIQTTVEAVPVSEVEFRNTFKRPTRHQPCLADPDEYYFLPISPTSEAIDFAQEWIEG